MKKLLYAAFLLLPLLAQAQTEKFVLKGSVGTKAGVTKVYLQYPVNKVFIADSTVVQNGHFEFNGTLLEPVRAAIVLSRNGTSMRQSKDHSHEFFFLEKGTIVWTTLDSAAKATVRGTPLNDETARLHALLKPLNDRYNALEKDVRARPEATRNDPTYSAQFRAQLAAIEAAQQHLRVQYVQAHPDAHYSLFVLLDLEQAITEDERYALYQGLSAGVRNSLRGQRVGAQIKSLQQVAVGSMAPDFTQNTPANVPVKLSSLRGKYVLLDFWASWCVPCRQENPQVLKAYTTFKDKGFTVLGVSLDEERSRKAWVRAIQQDGLTWPQVSDLKAWNNAAAQAFGVHFIPQNFLLDPQGKIIATNLRGEELQSTLAKLLNAPN